MNKLGLRDVLSLAPVCQKQDFVMETKYKANVGHIARTPGVRIVQSSITIFALEEFLTSPAEEQL